MRPERGYTDRERSELWRISAMGSELAFGIIGMVFLGIGIDYLFHTKPAGVVICTIVGVIASGYNFIRRALVIARASQEQAKRPHDARSDTDQNRE